MKLALKRVCAVWVSAALWSAALGERPDDDAPATPADDDDAPLALLHQESRNVRPRAYHQQQGALNALPSGFRPPGAAASLAELAGYAQPRPQQGSRGPPAPPRPARPERPARPADEAEEEREEEEREEPDRLAALLQQSKFSCGGRQTGYYADQDLGCEVFHYCQESVKHSWLCPDGFTFHQVHLICMPPTQDNICEKSAKYHFVNEYLYRPINEEEVQRRPNVSLRYSDRYYPAEVYRDDRYEQDDDGGDDQDERRFGGDPPSRHQHQQHQQHQQQQYQQQQHQQQQQQVFRSAEEVDIPLSARRPASPAPAQPRPYHFAF